MLTLQSKQGESLGKHAAMNQWIASQGPKMSQLVAPRAEPRPSAGRVARVAIGEQTHDIRLPAKESVTCGWLLSQVLPSTNHHL